MAAEPSGRAAAPPGERRTQAGYEGDCPRCGTAYAPLQEYCLECGLRLPRDEPAATSSPTARIVPGAGPWLLPVLVAGVVALLAVVAIVAARLLEEPADEVVIATTEIPPVLPGTSPPEAAPVQELPTLPPERTATRGAPRPQRQAEQLESWPQGESGWTVVLASVPQDAGRSTATAMAKEASDAGVGEVGLLDSSRFASLHPGYYVVFSGVHDSRQQAEEALSEVRDRGYDAAYVREIAS